MTTSAQTWKISARFYNTKLASGDIEDKIDVFEDWMNGWTLRHAHPLCDSKYVFRDDAGFAVLTIATSYFEPIHSYLTGRPSRGTAKIFFRSGFLSVFPDLPATLTTYGYPSPQALAEQIADEIYDQLRCGLYHEGGTKHKLLIRHDTAPLSFMLEKTTGEVGSIVVDPPRFLAEIQHHLDNYVGKLRDPSQVQLRRNFETFFDHRMSATATVLPPPTHL
ncbi:MAG: hypothetical protein ACRD2K_00700 [Terriglobales bacterium]